MATHKLIANKEGGYFYRFYPKIANPKFKQDDSTIQSDLFNPVAIQQNFQVVRNIYGKFIDKYNDKGLVIEMIAEAEYLITDTLTSDQEPRILQSKFIVTVPDHIYNYPFIKNNIYCLTVEKVIPL